jgi:uncharacterized Zn finger protein
MASQSAVDEIKASIRGKWTLGEALGAKAQSYVGKFFDRTRTGKRIVAKVRGNHGTYTVSLDVKAKGIDSACSCYIGKHGGCHHCRALAQTFLDDAESFTEIKRKRRVSLRTMEDVEDYLDSVTLDDLLRKMKEQGVTQTAFAESVGMNPRRLSAVKSSELRNRYFNELGAIKLACLWVIENIKPSASQKRSRH